MIGPVVHVCHPTDAVGAYPVLALRIEEEVTQQFESGGKDSAGGAEGRHQGDPGTGRRPHREDGPAAGQDRIAERHQTLDSGLHHPLGRQRPGGESGHEQSGQRAAPQVAALASPEAPSTRS